MAGDLEGTTASPNGGSWATGILVPPDQWPDA